MKQLSIPQPVNFEEERHRFEMYVKSNHPHAPINRSGESYDGYFLRSMFQGWLGRANQEAS